MPGGDITYDMLKLAYIRMSEVARWPETYLEIETVIGYQEAWRWFLYYPSLDRFRSLTKDHTWNQYNEMVADEIPSLDNQNGFYAFKSDGVEEAGSPVHQQYFYVFAQIALYGIVIEHEFGYRGEKARILQAWYPRSMPNYLAPKNWSPFVGCWYLESSTLYDAYDREVTKTWLTLENPSESEDSSLSSSHTSFPAQASHWSLTYGAILRNGLSSPSPARRWSRTRSKYQRKGHEICGECGERIEIWQVMSADKERHADCSYAPLWTRSGLPNPQLEEYLRPKVILPEWIERGGLRLPIGMVIPDEYETYWRLM